MKLIVAFLLGAALAWDKQPLTICYQTDGQTIRTAYISPGLTDLSPYPIETTMQVDHNGDTVTASHSVVLRVLRRHVFLPVVHGG